MQSSPNLLVYFIQSKNNNVYKAIIYHKKNLTNDRNIPGIKNLHLNHISKYLVKLMSSMYAFYIFKTKHDA